MSESYRASHLSHPKNNNLNKEISMTTEKQFEANRQNALKSTGPASVEGNIYVRVKML